MNFIITLSNKTNFNIQQVKGEILLVSQFTLCAETKKGNRPSFVNAMEPNEAKKLCEKFNITGKNVTDGIPKTIQISTDEITKALNSSVSAITEAIRQALDLTPPEHSIDIMRNGIILTGGGSLLKGLAFGISEFYFFI